MAIELDYPPGATPLDPDEANGLIPGGVSTVDELNAYESENILEAMDWIESQRRADVLDDAFPRELHRRMFSRTWQWAGAYRTTEKNIGVAPEKIATSIRDLLLDGREQLKSKPMPLDEIAARFHHRLVSIHPFANGNGRHARLMTDLLLTKQGALPFSWGAANLDKASPMRERYIAALRAADGRDLGPLFRFVRT